MNFLSIPGCDGRASEHPTISTSRRLRCRSAANQQASSACCRSSPCSASPPSWRNTPCLINMAGHGGQTHTRTHTHHHTCVFLLFSANWLLAHILCMNSYFRDFFTRCDVRHFDMESVWSSFCKPLFQFILILITWTNFLLGSHYCIISNPPCQVSNICSVTVILWQLMHWALLIPTSVHQSWRGRTTCTINMLKESFMYCADLCT